MDRRRLLKPSNKNEWHWDYTMGLPSGEFEYILNHGTTLSLESDGLLISSSTSTSGWKPDFFVLNLKAETADATEIIYEFAPNSFNGYEEFDFAARNSKTKFGKTNVTNDGLIFSWLNTLTTRYIVDGKKQQSNIGPWYSHGKISVIITSEAIRLYRNNVLLEKVSNQNVSQETNVIQLLRIGSDKTSGSCMLRSITVKNIKE